MNNQKQKMYLAPTIKVVAFTVEHGFAATEPNPSKSVERLNEASGSTSTTGSGWDNGWNE